MPEHAINEQYNEEFSYRFPILHSEVHILRRDVDSLKNNVDDIKRDVSSLKSDLSELKRNFSDSRLEQQDIKSDLRDTKTELNGELFNLTFENPAEPVNPHGEILFFNITACPVKDSARISALSFESEESISTTRDTLRAGELIQPVALFFCFLEMVNDENGNIKFISKFLNFTDSIIILSVHMSFTGKRLSEDLKSVNDDETSVRVFL